MCIHILLKETFFVIFHLYLYLYLYFFIFIYLYLYSTATSTLIVLYQTKDKEEIILLGLVAPHNCQGDKQISSEDHIFKVFYVLGFICNCLNFEIGPQ